MRLSARRLRVWITLAAFLGTFAVPVATLGHFTADDDAACGQISPVAGHLTTQFESPQAAPPLEHCALCHWLRAVGGASPSVPRVVAVVATLNRVAPPAAERAAESPVVSQRSSRAPPSL